VPPEARLCVTSHWMCATAGHLRVSWRSWWFEPSPATKCPRPSEIPFLSSRLPLPLELGERTSRRRLSDCKTIAAAGTGHAPILTKELGCSTPLFSTLLLQALWVWFLIDLSCSWRRWFWRGTL
jgi:hypothetical protein